MGSGTFDAVQTAQGYLLGFSDPSGFSTLTITDCGTSPCTLSGFNAIAIDNVTADVTPFSTTAPEPSTLMLLGINLLGVALVGLGWKLHKSGASSTRATTVA